MTRADLMKTIIVTAQYYGRDLQPSTVAAMADDLIEISPQNAIEAYVAWRKDSRHRAMPTPSDIIATVRGSPASPEAIGREVASRVVHAVSAFGWCNGKEAMAYVGDAGWRAVQRMGGWKYLCENLGTELSVLTFQAQCRDLVASHVEFASKGISIDSPPEIESRRGGLTRIGELNPGGSDDPG